ncbi:MAG: hypothetical protein MUC92_06340 [Fimbriimonadaceae bacterium]|jgi:uncharacterized membrane protein|nr:hypothetical protein [Fimbriimonadaceae bacterium]
MVKVLVATVIHLVLMTLLSLNLPDQVPTKFDFQGKVIHSEPRLAFLTGAILFPILIGWVLYGAGILASKGRINGPRDDHWNQPENRPRAVEIVRNFTSFFGSIMLLWLSVFIFSLTKTSLAEARTTPWLIFMFVFVLLLVILTLIKSLFTALNHPERSVSLRAK